MRFLTQATLPQSLTLYSQSLFAPEATATPIDNRSSLPLGGFATVTATISSSQSNRRIVWQAPNVVMDGIPTTFVTVTATATKTPTGRPLLEPVEVGLPDWSPLLTIFLLTWVAMAWILALVIFLATFSEKVAWLDRVIARRWWGDRHGASKSKASTNTYRSRKIGDIESSIQDTATVATGLGISFNGALNTPRLRKPRSFDRNSLRTHDPRLHANIASTAPLPSDRSFVELSPTSTETSVHVKDLESGKYESSVSMNTVPEERRSSEVGGIVGVVESVNAVIGFVADRLARMTSDRVTGGAERDLLLPVKKNESAPMAAELGGCGVVSS